VLDEIERSSPDVGIVTLAPEIPGGLDLIRWLSDRGVRASLGHSAATCEEGLAAVAAGARQATHLFNRMPPMLHREPGLAGAALQADEVAAEIICDGLHVHPLMIRVAVAAKRAARVMAITDGTSLSGVCAGADGRLGGASIRRGRGTALLADGTRAGSLLTMDGAFRLLVGQVGASLIDAVAMCATTQARELGLVGHGVLAVGAAADLVILDRRFEVVQTYVGGVLAYSRAEANPLGQPSV
jgi:N-acetylglucosamine-6-phosphate deacetylase